MEKISGAETPGLRADLCLACMDWSPGYAVDPFHSHTPDGLWIVSWSFSCVGAEWHPQNKEHSIFWLVIYCKHSDSMSQMMSSECEAVCDLAEHGGRVMMRGRAVRTSSPRKASVIRFCRVLSRISSIRSPNSGLLQRGMRYRYRKMTIYKRESHRVLTYSSIELHRVPAVLILILQGNTYRKIKYRIIWASETGYIQSTSIPTQFTANTLKLYTHTI